MKKGIVVFAVFCSVTLAACSSTILNVKNVKPDQKNSGIVYYLPQAVLQFSIQRELVDCKDGAQVLVTPELKIDYIAEKSKAFYVDYVGSEKATRTSDIKIDLYQNGTLKSVNTHMVDKTGEVITNTITGIGSLVSAAATMGMMGLRGLPKIDQIKCSPKATELLNQKMTIHKNIEDAAKEIAVLKLKPADKLTDAQAEHLSEQQSKLDKNTADLSRVTQALTLRTVYRSAPASTEESPLPVPLEFTKLLDGNGKEKFSTVYYAVQIPPAVVSSPIASSELQIEYADSGVGGIVYRQPVQGNILMYIKEKSIEGPINPLLSELITIPQFGIEAYLPFRNGTGQDNTLSATFEKDGTLTSVQYISNATALKISEDFKNSASATSSLINALQEGQKNSIKFEKDKIDIEKDRINAQLELEKKKKELENFRKGQ